MMAVDRHVFGHRLFYAPPPWPGRGSWLWLSRAESRHAHAVLRLGGGDRVMLVDGQGYRASGEIAETARGQVRVRLLAIETAREEQGPRRILALPWIRSHARLDWVIEKGTELGIHEFRLFHADRSLKRTSRSLEVRMKRWNAVSLAAMKQSGRAWLPGVRVWGTLADVIEPASDATIIVADADGAAKIDTRRRGGRAGTNRILVVGPEGGLTPDEHQLLGARGAQFVSLGLHRLRVETAAIALCARTAEPRSRGVEHGKTAARAVPDSAVARE